MLHSDQLYRIGTKSSLYHFKADIQKIQTALLRKFSSFLFILVQIMSAHWIFVFKYKDKNEWIKFTHAIYLICLWTHLEYILENFLGTDTLKQALIHNLVETTKSFFYMMCPFSMWVIVAFHNFLTFVRFAFLLYLLILVLPTI